MVKFKDCDKVIMEHKVLMERPKVGVGVIIIKDDKVLMQQRRNAHGSGCWSFPGGHLEFNELIEDCAQREVLEETGLKIKNLKLGPYTNDQFLIENKHYITLYVIAEYSSGSPAIMEPEKCEQMNWFSWDDLPSPLFLPIQNLVKQNFNPFKKD